MVWFKRQFNPAVPAFPMPPVAPEFKTLPESTIHGGSRVDLSGERLTLPLLPILLPLVLAASVLAVTFAWLFPAADAARPVPVARFTDITKESGIRFVHCGGGKDSLTTLSGAVVVFDYDRDGRPDLFFVNGAPWPWEEASSTPVSTCALYHNDGGGHFTDVTHAAGLDFEMQGMSAAAGDYDNDGYPDLFITGVGENRLLHNQRDGTFVDVTATAGVGGDGQTWSTGATWIDIDGDGLLDLVVANYARWPEEVGLATAFGIAQMGHSYGTPNGFMGAFPSVYRNLGQGRFALVPGAAGLCNIDPQTHMPVAKALAVTPLDANGDGRLDLLFSYQTSENALFINQGDGTFRHWSSSLDDRNEGAAAGFAAAGGLTLAQGARADERVGALLASGALDANSRGEPYLNLSTKLGVAVLDYEHDGHLDLFSGNGRAEPDLNRFEAGRQFSSVPQLLWSHGRAWVPASPAGAEGGGWAVPAVARGVAVADFDGDGDSDVIIAQNNGAAIILRNDQRSGSPWLRIALIATRTQPDAGGARVEVRTPRRVLIRTVAPAMGYMAQSESVLDFGLGEDARVRKIAIHWPSGQRQELRPEAINRTLVIREP
jgi:hypothetical protein